MEKPYGNPLVCKCYFKKYKKGEFDKRYLR